MSYTIRMRRVAYDNIAVGSVTGRERTKGTNSTEVLGRENMVAGAANTRTTDCLDHILTATTARTTEFTNEII